MTTARGIVSAIIPTIGRADSLARLLDSLEAQSRLPDEVVVADGSAGVEVAHVASRPGRRLVVRLVAVSPPHAVRQRQAAIGIARGDLLLLLDDDVVLEPGCVEAMVEAMAAPGVVAVVADHASRGWAGPTTLWRWYLRWCHGLRDGEWQGRVIGPLLRFGYEVRPLAAAPMEWIATGHSLIRRAAYDRVGGFSDFFLHRATANEDVDLGLKLAREGRIVLCPAARMTHLHAPGGRLSVAAAAEDDLYNRYLILCRTQGRGAAMALGLVLVYFVVETTSNVAGGLRRWRGNNLGARSAGRLRALARVLGLVIAGRARA